MGPTHMLMARLLNIVLAIGDVIFVMHTKIVTDTLALINRFLQLVYSAMFKEEIFASYVGRMGHVVIC